MFFQPCGYVVTLKAYFLVRFLHLVFFPSGAPRHLDVARIREDLLKLEDVQSVEELKIWALTTDKTIAVVHLQLCKCL